MPFNDDDFEIVEDAPPSSGRNEDGFEVVGQTPSYSPNAVSPRPASRIRRLLSDPALSLAKGVVAVPEAVVGILDIPTLGLTGKIMELGGYGFQPKLTKEFLSEFYSPEQKASTKRVDDAKGFFGTVEAMVKNPSTIAHTTIESVPSMLGGGAIAKGAMSALPKIAAMPAGEAAAVAAMRGITPAKAAADFARQQLLQRGIKAGAAGEALISAGSTAERARQESESGFLTPKKSLVSAASGAAVGLIGLLGGKLAARLGADDIDTLMAGGRSTATREAQKNVVQKVLTSALEEAGEEVTQSTIEAIAGNITTGRPWNEGIGEQAAQGMMAGGIMGGIGGGSGPILRGRERSRRLASLNDFRFSPERFQQLLKRRLDLEPDIAVPKEEANRAVEIPSAEEVSQREVRTPVGEATPLRQPGQAPVAPVEQAQVAPQAPPTPPVISPQWLVNITPPAKLGEKQLPGAVQIDMMEGEENKGSTNPDALRSQGLNIPSKEDFFRLPKGRYTMAQALELLQAKEEPLAQPVREPSPSEVEYEGGEMPSTPGVGFEPGTITVPGGPPSGLSAKRKAASNANNSREAFARAQAEAEANKAASASPGLPPQSEAGPTPGAGSNEAKAAEDAQIAEGLRLITESFLPPPPPKGGPEPRGSGGPDTTKAIQGLRLIGDAVLKKVGRNFNTWQVEMNQRLSNFNFPNLNDLLQQVWQSLTGEQAQAQPAAQPKPQGFLKQKLAAGKPTATPEEVADQDAIRKDIEARGNRETPKVPAPAADPKFQVGAWMDRAHETAARTGGLDRATVALRANALSWMKRAWPGLAEADIRTLTKADVYGWMQTMKERAARQEQVGKLVGEPAVNYDTVKRGMAALRNGIKLATLGELAGQATDPTAGLELKDVGLKAPKTLSSQLPTPTVEQSRSIIDALTGRFNDLGRAMFLTGVRPGEILKAFNKIGQRAYEALRWSEINLEDGTMDLRRKRTKNKSLPSAQRVVPLTPEAIEFFRDLKRRNPPASPDSEIFGDIAEYQSKQFNQAVRDAVLNSGMNVDAVSADKIRGDIFRKMFATRMQNTLSTKDVANLIGDTESVVKKWYSLLPSMSELKAKVSQVPNALNSQPIMPSRAGEAGVASEKRSVEDRDASGMPFWKTEQKLKPLKVLKNFKKGATGRWQVVSGKELKGPLDRAGMQPVIVWERNDGTHVLITGRHRTELADREGVAEIPAHVYRERDGFTEAMAAVKDAEQNIRDNQGTIYDIAYYFRKTNAYDESEARRRDLFRNPLARNAFIIGRDATDGTFKEWYGTDGNAFSDAHALAIVTAAPKNEAAQALGRKIAKEGGSATKVYNLVSRASKETPEMMQGDMFAGTAVFKDMEREEEAADAIRKELRQRIGVQAAPAKNRELASEEGVEVTKSTAEAEARLIELRDKLAQLGEEWWVGDKPIADEVRKRAGTFKSPEAPKLRPGENAGELLQGADAPFNLAGEKGTDAERIAAEQAKAESDAQAAAEFERKNQWDMFGDNDPQPNLGTGLEPGEGMTLEEALDAIAGQDTAGFDVLVLSKDEAEALTGKSEARGYAGFFWNGNIYIVHENIARGDLADVREVLREEAGHGLLRTKEGLRLLQAALDAGKFNLTDSEKQVLRDQGYGESKFIDEFIAKSAREQLPWWRQAVESVRRFLSKFGLVTLSNAEVSRMLLKQIRRLNEGPDSLADARLPEIAAARRRPRHRIFGTRNIAPEYDPEQMEPIRQKLRASETFNATGDVTPDNTARIATVLSDLTNPALRENRILQLQAVDPSRMTGGIFVDDAWNYAVRMMQQGDPTLANYIVENVEDMATSMGVNTRPEVARELRSFQVDSLLWKNANAIYDAIENAAAGKLFGAEKMGEIGRILREELRNGPIIDPEQLQTIIEDKLTKEGLTPEIKLALRMLDAYERSQTEWLKPDVKKNIIKIIVDEALAETLRAKQADELDNGVNFRQRLSDRLNDAVIESLAANEKIDEMSEEDLETLRRQMDALALEVWKDKLAREATVTAKALAREEGAEQANAKRLIDRWEQDQVEWQKPEKKNEVSKIIQEFLKRNPIPEDQRTQATNELAGKLLAAGVRELTANELAYQAWNRKKTLEDARQQSAFERERKKMVNFAPRYIKQIIDRLQVRYTEWANPETQNLLAEIYKREISSKNPKPIYRAGEATAQLPVEELYVKDLADEFQAAAENMGSPISRESAEQAAREIAKYREDVWATANQKAMESASKSKRLSGLMEEIITTPWLVQQSPMWRTAVAIRWFESNGLNKEQAKAAAKMFTDEFDRALDAASVRIGERMVARLKNEGAKIKLESVEDFIKAIRAGILDPSKPWIAAYAEKAGFRLPTPEETQQLAILDLKLDNPDLELIERKEITEQMMALYSHMSLPPSLAAIVAANVVVTNLTGIKTFTVNAGGPIFFMGVDRALRTITNPRDFFNIWKPLVEAFRNFHHEFWNSVSTNAYTFINNDVSPASREFQRLWEDGLKDIKSNNPKQRAKGLLKMVSGSQQFFMRALNSLDQASGVMVREAQMSLYGGMALRQAGLSNSDVAKLTEAVHRIKAEEYNKAIEKGYSKTRAKVHADAVTAELLQDWVTDNLPKGTDEFEAINIGQKVADAAENDAYSVLGRLAPDIKEEDEGGILSHLGLHSLLEISSKLRRGTPSDKILAVSLLGYLNVPIRTARFYAWNSPYGLLRIGINKFRRWKGKDDWWKQSLGNEYQVRYRTKQAIAATAVQALLTAAGFTLMGKGSSDDDAGKEPLSVFVTGDGPHNQNLRDAWLKRGFRQNSLMMFVGGKAIAVPLTRLGEPMSHLFMPLAARDDYGWRKKEKEITGRPFEESAIGTAGYATGNYVSLLGQRGLIYNLSKFARAAGSEGGAKRAVADVAGSFVASATTPYLSLQRSFRDMLFGKVDTSSIQAALFANFPVLSAFGLNTKAINRFGDPLGNQTWYGKIANTGVPIAFQVSDNPENRKLYQMLVSKGVSPPIMRRAIVEEKYGVMNDEEYSKYAQRSGQILKRSVMSDFNGISRAPAPEAKKTLSSLASSADRLAATALGFEPVRPQATTSVRVASTGGGSAPRKVSVTAKRGGVTGRISIGGPRRLSLRSRSTRRLSLGSRRRLPSLNRRVRIAAYRAPRQRRLRLA